MIQPAHLAEARDRAREGRKRAHERARALKDSSAPRGYDPLGTCPPEQRDRYRKTAEKAASGSLAAIIKLKCLECCAWYSAEVRRCEIRGCALWIRATRHRPEGEER